MLDQKTMRPLSPMLAERFRFCGEWRHAHLSKTWLSLEQINNWSSNPTLKRWIDLSIENTYENEPPGGVSHELCAVYGFDP